MTSSAPIEFPYQEIVSVTNNFADANVIGEGGLGKVYKGKLSQYGESVNVAVRRIDHSYWLQDNAFAKEISILSKLKHKNLVSLVGFSEENDEILVIHKHVARGSLYMHLSVPTTLTWMRRLKISVGIASALKYMHNHEGRNYSVIHHNVNSTTILLDENWEAKLSGFEFSMVIQEGQQLDPAYERIGVGSYKSDAFSFGIVLFEILCGLKAFVSNDGKFQAPLAVFHYEGRKLHKLVDPDLFKQMDPQSFNIFSETAYDCLKRRQEPPNMNQILERLEKALKLQEKFENHEHSSTVVRRGPSDQLMLKLKQLEHMRIQLKDITNATNQFSPERCIASGGFGAVYKTKLDHVDRKYCFAIEGGNVSELPKEQSKVAVKRIFATEDESSEQGFYAEIEMLTSCKHSNILTLLGFCDEGSAMILVYEYARNKSLVDYLQNKSNKTNDSWAQRMKICLQVAKGLSYLHTREEGRQAIVHRDIKSANILLDENLDAKIGDFGLCKFLYSENEEHERHYLGPIAGTKVYMDPQYAKEGKLKKESDVYCLGVVMSEILCGKLAYDTIYNSHNSKGLAPTARWHVENKRVQEIVDPRMKEGITEATLPSIKRLYQDSFDMFLNIAYKCLDETQANRPTLECVIKELEEALPFQEFFNDILRNRRGNKTQEKEPKSS